MNALQLCIRLLIMTLLLLLLVSSNRAFGQRIVEPDPPAPPPLPSVTIDGNGLRLHWGSTVEFSEHMTEHEADRVAFYLIVKVGSSHYLIPAHYPIKPQPKLHRPKH